MQSVYKLRDLPFKEQFDAVEKMGFALKVKRATVGTSKHVRVRAMFKTWTVSGIIQVSEPAITKEILQNMFRIAGRYVGLMDWRPGSKTPGPYGTFEAALKAA